MGDWRRSVTRCGAAPLLVAALVATSARPAFADGTATANESSEAEKRFAEGLDLYQKGKIEEARVKFLQAYGVLLRVNILWNLAISEYFSNRKLDALRHFRKFVKAPDAVASDAKLAREKFIPEIEHVVGRIRVETTDGAEVSVDGEVQLGAAPLDGPVDAAPGKHHVRAVAKGDDRSVDVDVAPGAVATASLIFPVAIAPPPPTAHADATTATPPPGLSGRVVTTLALAGGAIVATGVGVVFSLNASSASSRAGSFGSQLPTSTSACFGITSGTCADFANGQSDAPKRQERRDGALRRGAECWPLAPSRRGYFWPSSRSTESGTSGANLTPLVGTSSVGAELQGHF